MYRRGGANQGTTSNGPRSVIGSAPWLALLLLIPAARGQTNITLAWDAVQTPGVAGYRIYYGTASRKYTNSVIVTNGTRATINGLKQGTTYFFSATTLGSTLVESPFSAEVRYPDIPPAIVLTSPANGSTYDPSSPITLAASVTTNGHTINIVRFYDGPLLLGSDSTPPYGYTLLKAVSNSYSFHATVTYDGTNSISSSVVNVSVSGGLIGNLPLLATLPPTNRQFRLMLSGQPSHTYDVLASENLRLWKTISTVTLGPGGSVIFTDPEGAKYSSRFYRLHETTYTVPGSLPTLRIRRLGAGLVALDCVGQVGHTYDILASNDLKAWIAITTFTAGNSGAFTFTDPAAPAHSSRFYRLHETTYIAPGTIPALQMHTAGGKVLLTALGEVAHRYDVLASQDLVHWSTITNVTVPATGSMTVSDPAAGSFRSRFYRLHETTY
jgi:hypothetical protein